jgi:hypothetical protein
MRFDRSFVEALDPTLWTAKKSPNSFVLEPYDIREVSSAMAQPH